MLAAVVYILLMYLGLGFIVAGYRIVTQRTYTHLRRKYPWSWTAVEISESGIHVVPVGIGDMISGFLLLVTSVQQIIIGNHDFFGYMLGVFIVIGLIKFAMMVPCSILSKRSKRNL